MQNSIGTDFYVETLIIIDPLFCNNTPVLTNEPVDAAAIGTTFLHNPGAYDPDGDSLSYKLVVPQQATNTPVNGYDYPDAYDRASGGNPTKQDGSTPVTMTLDSITGLLTWDAPANAGEYNVAFIIEEWRKINGTWVFLGYVTRDMQIIVKDSENHPPELTVVRDTCVEAGTLLELNVTATDEDGDPVRLDAFGEPFELGTATFSPSSNQTVPTPAEGTFLWTPDCAQVRTEPYQVNFKATDVPATGPPLADFVVWNVTVVAPAPQNLSATLAKPPCLATVGTLPLCRRGGGHPRVPSPRQQPLGAGRVRYRLAGRAGYELIGQVAPDLVGFGDPALQPGLTYCYRLVAVYANGSESYASEEVCVSLPATAPLMTEMSVLDTDPVAGRMAVAWVAPPDIDSVAFPGPYTYTLVRATGFSGSAERRVIAENLAANAWVDTDLNTTDQVYHYRVYLYDATGQLADSSATASSVRLELTPQAGSIELDWRAEVPWTNQTGDYPYHYIYRAASSGDDPAALVLVDSVRVTEGSFTYLDQELSDQQEYCYVVTTQGKYENQPLLPAPCATGRNASAPSPTIPFRPARLRCWRLRWAIMKPTAPPCWLTSPVTSVRSRIP